MERKDIPSLQEPRKATLTAVDQLANLKSIQKPLKIRTRHCGYPAQSGSARVPSLGGSNGCKEKSQRRLCEEG